MQDDGDEASPPRRALVVSSALPGNATESLREAMASLDVHMLTVASNNGQALVGMRGQPDIVLFDVDFGLILGTRVEVALRCLDRTVPLIAIGGPLNGSTAFRLAAVGVSNYLDLPICRSDVVRCLATCERLADPIARAARLEVGMRDVREAQRILRLSMYQEALNRTGGNRRAAAKLLGVNRRAVQKIAIELADLDPATGPRSSKDVKKADARAPVDESFPPLAPSDEP